MRYFLFFCFLGITMFASAQSTATLSVSVLTTPPGHNCPGVIRCEYNTCNCLEQYGIDLSINGIPWGRLIKCYGTGPGITDISLAPGEYDIVGTVSGNSGCDNYGQKFNFHVTLNNPACDPGYFTYEVQQPPGYKCNGSINNIIYHSTNCVASHLIDIYLVNSDGSEYFLDHYNPNGDNHSVAPGSYSLKAVVNNECSTISGGIIISEAPCPTITMTYDSPEEVGFNCSTSLNHITANANPPVCLGTNYFDKYVYDENMNQIGFAHEDGIFNVNVISGHTYYMQTTINGVCKSDLIEVKVPPTTCTATLTEVSRKDSIAGILCPDANKIELKYTANACYDNWTLQESNSQLLGYEGSWSAAKGENITVSLPELRNAGNKFRFIATSNDLKCIAKYKPSGFKNKGCDGKISAHLIHAESSPGAGDAEYGFTITGSACTDQYGDPWVITLLDVSTKKSYGAISDNRETTIGGLSAGTYKVSFGDHAGICTYKNVKTITVPAASLISKEDSKRNQNKGLNVFLAPNPAGKIIYIYGLKTKVVSVELLDINGKVLYKNILRNNSINISNLSPGNYFVKLIFNDHTETLKFVKQ